MLAMRQARARRVRNEDVRVRNTEHDIEELRVHRSDRLVVEVVHHRHATDHAVRECAEPRPFLCVVVVFPVGSEHAGILKGVRADDRIADEVGIARHFDTVEAVSDIVAGAHFGLQIVVERFALAEQVNSVVEFLVGAIHNLLEQRSALGARIVRKVSTAEKLHFGINLEGVRLELQRGVTVTGVLRDGNDHAQRECGKENSNFHLDLSS